MSKELTIFDKILAGDIKADIVYEDEHVLAFKDVNPQAPIHVLVIPKKKMTSFIDCEKQSISDLGNYMNRISLVANKIGLNVNGYRIIFNHGKDGQQTVNYIHAHILGGRSLHWPPG